MTASTMTRQFRLGITLLPDPNPALSPEDAIKLYEVAYPIVAGCSLTGPETVGTCLIYTVQRRTVQTKGIDYVESGAGCLLFDTGGALTPLIKAIFAPYGLSDDDGDDPEQAYVAHSSHGDVTVERVFAGLAGWARQQGVPVPEGRVDLVLAAARHLGVAVSLPEVRELAAPGADPDDDYPLALAVELAMLLDDGHGLAGIDYQSAVTASRPVYEGFGGHALRIGRHVHVSQGTDEIADLAEGIESALARSDVQAAAVCIEGYVARWLDAIHEPHRAAVAAALADGLAERVCAHAG